MLFLMHRKRFQTKVECLTNGHRGRLSFASAWKRSLKIMPHVYF